MAADVGDQVLERVLLELVDLDVGQSVVEDGELDHVVDDIGRVAEVGLVAEAGLHALVGLDGARVHERRRILVVRYRLIEQVQVTRQRTLVLTVAHHKVAHEKDVVVEVGGARELLARQAIVVAGHVQRYPVVGAIAVLGRQLLQAELRAHAAPVAALCAVGRAVEVGHFVICGRIGRERRDQRVVLSC